MVRTGDTRIMVSRGGDDNENDQNYKDPQNTNYNDSDDGYVNANGKEPIG